MKISTRLLVCFLPFALSACGGGSSGNSSAPIAVPVLSESQKNYESMALAGNGGVHFLSGYLNLTSTPPDAAVFDAESFFYTSDSTIPQSALNGPQRLTRNNSKLAATLAIPDFGRARMLVDGTVYVSPSPSIEQVSYSGNNVLYQSFAADGKTVISSYLYTNYTAAALNGLLANSPRELLSNSDLGQVIYPNYSEVFYNKSASWQAGAAYMKVEGRTVGNRVFVEDCSSPVTTGADVAPCTGSATTLETAFPLINFIGRQPYQFIEGEIVSIAGVRAWVSREPIPAVGDSSLYRVFYENKGKIYMGMLMKDGTPSQTTSTANGSMSNFFIYLNNAAVQSIKSVLKF